MALPLGTERSSGVQLARRAADPYVNKKGIKICTVVAMLQSFDMLRAAVGSITCPILALHGERDHVCPLDAVRRLLDEGVDSSDKTLETFPEGLHDIQHDFEALTVEQRMLTWIDAHGALPAA
jgi:esterase/lipase